MHEGFGLSHADAQGANDFADFGDAVVHGSFLGWTRSKEQNKNKR
jgi:hypothetical protein